MSNSIAIIPPASGVAIDPRRAALAADPFEPQSMGELQKFSEAVAATDFAPKEYKQKPHDCFIAMLYGKSLGLSALQALQGIGVINGKPTVYGDTFWALIVSHPDFVDCIEDVTEERAEVKMFRRNREPYTIAFTMEEAKLAGLDQRTDVWKKYPKGQMLWRARHRAATALFADALKGILPREIALDFSIEGERPISLPREQPALSPEAASGAPAVAAKGDQAKPAEEAKQSDDRPVNNEEMAAWDEARKRTGWKAADARALFTNLGVSRVGEIRISQLADAMKWAENGPKSEQPKREPEAVQEPAPQKEEAQAKPEEGGPIDRTQSVEQTIDEALTALDYGMFEREQVKGVFTKNGVTDWGALSQRLQREAKSRGVEL